MSHFTVLVIGDDVEAQLAPFHEFECTGEDDRYVVDVDRTEEAQKKFDEVTVRRLRLADGSLVSPYGEDGNYRPEFLRRPTSEERAEVDREPLGSASFEKTGYGDKMRVVAFPEGAQDVEVPAKDHERFAQWAADYFGSPIVRSRSEIDLTKEHKYGYTLVEGDEVKVVDRTNPNKRWDWFQVGGRWSGFFTLKLGRAGALGERSLLMKEEPPVPTGTADVCLRRDVDVERMRDDAGREAGERYDRAAAILAGRTFKSWGAFVKDIEDAKLAGDAEHEALERARDAYHAQPAVRDLQKVREFAFEDLERYLEPREEFVQAARDAALGCYAVLHDGVWRERGRMGWFGMASDEQSSEQWAAEFNRFFDSLPDDALLTIVDCHI